MFSAYIPRSLVLNPWGQRLLLLDSPKAHEAPSSLAKMTDRIRSSDARSALIDLPGPFLVLLTNARSSLLESGLLSDATVKCGSKTWRVHRAILCSRNYWFNKALNGHFEVGHSLLPAVCAFDVPMGEVSCASRPARLGASQEAKTCCVEIEDFDPELVGWLITYIYTGCEFFTSNRISDFHVGVDPLLSVFLSL